jgi:hypothetical protein
MSAQSLTTAELKTIEARANSAKPFFCRCERCEQIRELIRNTQRLIATVKALRSHLKQLVHPSWTDAELDQLLAALPQSTTEASR